MYGFMDTESPVFILITNCFGSHRTGKSRCVDVCTLKSFKVKSGNFVGRLQSGVKFGYF